MAETARRPDKPGPPLARNPRRPLLVAAVVALLFLTAWYYTRGLTKWLAYDDEGGYLYAAWRITLGEVPYRDFLTPQLPVFLYPGALVLKATALSVWWARAYMTVLVLLTSGVLVALLRRHWGWPAALCGFMLFVLHRESFWAARFFRPEAPMLAAGVLGLALVSLGIGRERRLTLVLGGVSLGLASMAKLFGFLMAGGIAIWLLSEGVRSRDWKAMWARGLCVGLPYIVVVAAFGVAFMRISPAFTADVLGHHLRQGSGTPPVEVMRKAASLFAGAARSQPAFTVLATLGAIVALRGARPEQRLFVWQFPTALAFFAMTRELQERHLTYLVPSSAALGGIALGAALGWAWRKPFRIWRIASGLAAVALGASLSILPHIRYNALVANWAQDDVAEWIDLIQRRTTPGAYVLSDYPGLNFLARRPTTSTAAGISRGAALSGQITGAALIDEMEQHDVQMVLLNVAQGAHQFVLLRDYATLKQYVQTHFYLTERRPFDYRLMEVYERLDAWEGERTALDLGHALSLTGIRWTKGSAAAGEDLEVMLRFQKTSREPVSGDYSVALRLIDDGGYERALGSKPLVDIDRETYWDERGLEQPVLVPTSRWPVGETTIGLHEIPVDGSTPPGRYRVVGRLYTVGAWNGLMAYGPDGAPLGYDFPLGQVTVLPAVTSVDTEMLPNNHLGATLLPDIRLVAFEPLPEVARAGERIAVATYWSALTAPSRDYTMRLRLLGETGGLVGETLGAPVGAQFLTTAWRPGQVLKGIHDLKVDANAATGKAMVTLDLLNGECVSPTVSLGEIDIQGVMRQFVSPAYAASVGAQFGGAITLVGFDLPNERLAPGDPLRLRLVWRCDRSLQRSYQVFVHVVDSQNVIRGQADRVPQGDHPTDLWVPGEYIDDGYLIGFRGDEPAGQYTIAVGLYSGETGLRMEAYDASGLRLPDDWLPLAHVTLGP